MNVDLLPDHSVDLTCNAGRCLPFESDRFAGIFVEHFLEHLPWRQRDAFLAECIRVLKPGGILRISVPDGGLYLAAYHDDPSWLMGQRDQCRTPMEVVNQVFRQGYEHQFCYDYETLCLYLQRAGFSEVQRQSFRKGSVPEMLLDRNERRTESLYVEGAKRVVPSRE
jgi:predicted SAM-dependent methyltransferase